MIRLRKPRETYKGHAIAAAPGTHAAAVEFLVRHAPDKNSCILDVGCHTGALIARMHDTGYARVEGVDLSRKFKGDPFPFTVADLNKPFDHLFEGKTFDALVVSEVIEHLDDPRNFLLQAHRILSPEGLIIGTTPNVGFFEGRLKFLLKGELWGFGANNYRSQRHISPITIEALPLLLEECGFNLLELTTAASFATWARKAVTAPIWIPMRALFGRHVIGESLIFAGRRTNNASSSFSSQELWGAGSDRQVQ